MTTKDNTEAEFLKNLTGMDIEAPPVPLDSDTPPPANEQGAEPEKPIVDDEKPNEDAEKQDFQIPDNAPPPDGSKPPVQENKDDTPPPPDNNHNTRIQELFGYNTIDDLLNSDIAEKVKKYDELTTQIQQLQAENEEIYSSASEINNPFANENLFKLNHLLKENPNLDIVSASKLLNADYNSMSAIDKIKLSMQVADPDMSDRLIERQLKQKFGVESLSDLNDSDIDADLRDDIDIAARKAVKELQKYQISSDLKYDEKFVPEKIKEKISQRNTQSEASEQEIERVWQPLVSSLETNFKEIPLPIYDKKQDKSIEYSKFVLDEKERKHYADYAMKLAKEYKAKEITPEIQQALNYAIYADFLTKNLPRIIQTVADKAANDEYARLKAFRDGVPTNKNNDKPDRGSQNRGGIEVLLNAAD